MMYYLFPGDSTYGCEITCGKRVNLAGRLYAVHGTGYI
jgi:hypothetical protein